MMESHPVEASLIHTMHPQSSLQRVCKCPQCSTSRLGFAAGLLSIVLLIIVLLSTLIVTTKETWQEHQDDTPKLPKEIVPNKESSHEDMDDHVAIHIRFAIQRNDGHVNCEPVKTTKPCHDFLEGQLGTNEDCYGNITVPWCPEDNGYCVIPAYSCQATGSVNITIDCVICSKAFGTIGPVGCRNEPHHVAAHISCICGMRHQESP